MIKLEIIIERLEAKMVLKKLKEAGIKRYTIFPDLHGKGSNVGREIDDLTDIMKNVMIMCIATEEEIQKAITAVKPLLNDYSGIMITSPVTLIS